MMLQYSNGISLIILFLNLKLHSLTVITMKGREFITWDIRENNIEVKSLRVVFKFRTVDPSGLILFSSNQEYGDFISVELIDGHIRYSSYFIRFKIHISPFAVHCNSWSQLKRLLRVLENWKKLGAIKLRFVWWIHSRWKLNEKIEIPVVIMWLVFPLSLNGSQVNNWTQSLLPYIWIQYL